VLALFDGRVLRYGLVVGYILLTHDKLVSDMLVDVLQADSYT
jgi:hypothetical protein